jgi:hypothetical protein
LGDGTIDWYIQSTLYHIYNVILLNLTHVKAFQTTHNYSILIRCIITFFIHRQQFIFVNHVNTYFKPCILLITHKGLGKVATLQMDWQKTHAPSSWHMPFCMNGIVHWKGDKLWILCTHKMSAKGEKVYVTNPSNEHNTFWTCPFHKTPNPKP